MSPGTDCSFIQGVQIDWYAVTGDTGVGGEEWYSCPDRGSAVSCKRRGILESGKFGPNPSTVTFQLYAGLTRPLKIPLNKMETVRIIVFKCHLGYPVRQQIQSIKGRASRTVGAQSTCLPSSLLISWSWLRWTDTSSQPVHSEGRSHALPKTPPRSRNRIEMQGNEGDGDAIIGITLHPF